MPAAIAWQPWLLLAAWWVLGTGFLLRVPRGVAPGEFAEDELLQKLSIRQQAKLGATGPDAVAGRRTVAPNPSSTRLKG